jgi:hypothetical protein
MEVQRIPHHQGLSLRLVGLSTVSMVVSESCLCFLRRIFSVAPTREDAIWAQGGCNDHSTLLDRMSMSEGLHGKQATNE